MNFTETKFIQSALRILLWIAICGLACLVKCKDSSAQPTTTTPIAPPHVIVVAIDGLAIDQLGCYGDKTPATPNIDQVAADGVKFARAYRDRFDRGPTDLLPLAKSETTVDALVGRFKDHLRQAKGGSLPFIGLLNLTMPSQQAESVSAIDQQVGQMMSAIQKSSASQDTLVIFYSTLRTQQGVYEVDLRVPVIARWPSGIEAGRTIDLLVTLNDITSTIGELTGGSKVKDSESLSLVPTMLSQPELQRQHEWLLWQWTSEGAKRQAIRSGGWKLLRTTDAEPWELYHLENDPTETNDQAGKRTDLVARMEQLFLAKADTRPPQPPVRQRVLKPTNGLQPSTIGQVISDSKSEFKGVAFDNDAVLMGAVSGLDSNGALHLNMVWDLQTGRRPVRFIHVCDADGQIISQVKANAELFGETESRKQILDYVEISSEQMQQAQSVKIGFYDERRKCAWIADGTGLKKWRFDVWTAQ